MMADFKKSTEVQGLEIHPDRTKILTNQTSNKLKEIEIDGMMITFVDQKTTEVQHRIRCATGSAVPGPRSPDVDRY